MASFAYFTTTKCHYLLFLLYFLFSPSFSSRIANISSNTRHDISCINHERSILLRLKETIRIDNCGILSSWSRGQDKPEDCCNWDGVSCDNRTHHVIGLNLSGASYYPTVCLEGGLSPYLFELSRLESLDLSFNHFQGETIPSFLGYLTNLRHLKLSNAAFTGEIPSQLGNLSHLVSLDLSYNSGIYAKNLSWVSRLTSLTDVNLSGSDLSKATDWVDIVSKLPVLRVLTLDDCKLSWTKPSSFYYSKSLHIIGLSSNGFSDYSIFQWFFGAYNFLKNHNPSTLVNVQFDLSNNRLQGSIPSEFGTLYFLSYLNLSNNQLQGFIPIEFGSMKALSHLDLSSNQLKGRVPSEFGTMDRLSYLDLSYNQFAGAIPCTLSKTRSLTHLDLSNNQLKGQIPPTVFHINSLSYLDLSNNRLNGLIPDSPKSLRSLTHLDFSSNSFSGPIPKCALLPQLIYLDLSYNFLTGDIPSELGQLKVLEYIDLSFNSLSGPVPPHLWRFEIDVFTGNVGLCGEPLPNICSSRAADVVSEHGDDNSTYGLYVSIGFGLCFGFLVFWVALMLNDSWRYAYFRHIDHMVKKIH